MRIKFFITAAVLGTVCAVSAPAVMPLTNTSCSAAEDQKSATGLISKCMLSCSGSSGMLDIYAKTQSTMVMDNIGFNDMILQKSSDGSNWSDELSLGTVVQSDLRYYTYSAQIKVDGGYFYRVTCIHYAEGTPYRSNVTLIQTAENTSKSFWMESDQGSHGAIETTPTSTVTYTTASSVTKTVTIPTTVTAIDLPEPPGETSALTAAAGSAASAATTSKSATASSAGTSSAGTTTTTSAVTSALSADKAKEKGSPTTGTSAPAAAAITVIAASAVARRTRKK